MREDITIFLIPYILSATTSFALTIHAADHYQVRGARWFMVMSLCQAAWTTLYVLELISPSVNEKLFWDAVQWIPSLLVAIGVIHFAMIISETKWRFPSVMLFALPAFVFAIVFLDSGRPLVYQNVSIEIGYPFDTLTYTYTNTAWIAMLYVYVLIIISVIILSRQALKTRGIRRRQIIWMIAGFVLVVALTFGFTLFDVKIMGQRDTAPFTFALGNTIVGWGLFRHRLFNLAPTARHMAVEMMADSFIVTDTEWHIIDMNKTARGTTDGIYHTVEGLFPEWAQQINVTQPHVGLIREFHRTNQGTVYTYEAQISPVYSSERQIDGYLIITRDVTERKLLEDALRKSEMRYRLMIDTMADGVMVFAADGRLITANLAAQRLFALDPQEVIGKRMNVSNWEFVAENGSPITDKDFPLTKALDAGASARNVVIGVTRPDGKFFWLSINAEPFGMDETAAKGGALVSIRDITAYKNMQVQTMQLQLEKERAKLLANFIRSASHEFRTPLSTISTSLYLLTRNHDEARQQEHIAKAESEIKRLARLVDLQVKLATLDSGISIQRQPVKLELLLEDLITSFSRRAANQRVNLHRVIEADLPVINGSDDYLHLALEQVIDNALRHTPRGGDIILCATASSDEVILTVQDTGTGIALEHMPHIFERFWRRDEAHTTPGFGLGLPLVQKVMELHFGTVDVQSEEGVGTIVTLKMPIS